MDAMCERSPPFDTEPHRRRGLSTGRPGQAMRARDIHVGRPQGWIVPPSHQHVHQQVNAAAGSSVRLSRGGCRPAGCRLVTRDDAASSVTRADSRHADRSRARSARASMRCHGVKFGVILCDVEEFSYKDRRDHACRSAPYEPPPRGHNLLQKSPLCARAAHASESEDQSSNPRRLHLSKTSAGHQPPHTDMQKTSRRLGARESSDVNSRRRTGVQRSSSACRDQVRPDFVSRRDSSRRKLLRDRVARESCSSCHERVIAIARRARPSKGDEDARPNWLLESRVARHDGGEGSRGEVLRHGASAGARGGPLVPLAGARGLGAGSGRSARRPSLRAWVATATRFTRGSGDDLLTSLIASTRCPCRRRAGSERVRQFERTSAFLSTGTFREGGAHLVFGRILG